MIPCVTNEQDKVSWNNLVQGNQFRRGNLSPKPPEDEKQMLSILQRRSMRLSSILFLILCTSYTLMEFKPGFSEKSVKP
jgi:hypothetical protein